VRRFNWFSYTDVKQPLNLAMNPEVSVRHRGVMEKCTFCIHRIKAAEAHAKVNDLELKDGDVRTACQDSCPTNAIVFGNINDPNSEVAKRFKEPMMYDLLEELNTKPSVRYHTKVRNVAKLKGHETGKEEEQHS
jgi:molybdopterin-containing oxidoreductase family iron-sulfur binding subunit